MNETKIGIIPIPNVSRSRCKMPQLCRKWVHRFTFFGHGFSLMHLSGVWRPWATSCPKNIVFPSESIEIRLFFSLFRTSIHHFIFRLFSPIPKFRLFVLYPKAILRIVIVIANNIYCIPTYVIWMMLLLPIRRCHPDLYYRIEGQFFHWMLSIVAMWSWTAGYNSEWIVSLIASQWLEFKIKNW